MRHTIAFLSMAMAALTGACPGFASTSDIEHPTALVISSPSILPGSSGRVLVQFTASQANTAPVSIDVVDLPTGVTAKPASITFTPPQVGVISFTIALPDGAAQDGPNSVEAHLNSNSGPITLKLPYFVSSAATPQPSTSVDTLPAINAPIVDSSNDYNPPTIGLQFTDQSASSLNFGKSAWFSYSWSRNSKSSPVYTSGAAIDYNAMIAHLVDPACADQASTQTQRPQQPSTPSPKRPISPTPPTINGN